MKTEFNLTKLAETAKSRWFKTPEISHLLKNINESNLKPLLVDKLPERPFNGSFFLIDGNKTNKKWKQDGYSYINTFPAPQRKRIKIIPFVNRQENLFEVLVNRQRSHFRRRAKTNYIFICQTYWSSYWMSFIKKAKSGF